MLYRLRMRSRCWASGIDGRAQVNLQAYLTTTASPCLSRRPQATGRPAGYLLHGALRWDGISTLVLDLLAGLPPDAGLRLATIMVMLAGGAVADPAAWAAILTEASDRPSSRMISESLV